MSLVDLSINHDVSLNGNGISFDYISSDDLSYSDFFNKYLLTNKPCVIKYVTKGWKCQKEWVSSSKPNFTHISANYGNAKVPAANCNEKYYNSQLKESMILMDYISYWKDLISSGYPVSSPSLYLKDWHFCRDFPDDTVYEVPVYFASDWLNEYYIGSPDLNDDYRFVYMGPKGTWTPMHKDVFSSFSWSVNICGRKEWLFYPPREACNLKDNCGNLIYDVTAPDLDGRFPALKSASSIKLNQGIGDAVFVPSGWYHQVWNKDDTISVNHNWVNSCNIEAMYCNLMEELESVEKELSDCTDSTEWTVMCQRLLKATFGLNLPDFLSFIKYIIEQRVAALKTASPLSLPSGFKLSLTHVQFDLNSLRPVLNKIRELSDYSDEASTFLEIIDDSLK